MATPEKVSNIWEQQIKPNISFVINYPVKTDSFFNVLADDLIKGMKPAVSIAQIIMAVSDQLAIDVKGSFPSFPKDLIFMGLSMCASSIIVTEPFRQTNVTPDVMEMIKANLRDDRIILSEEEGREIVDDIKRRAKLLSDDPTGKLFVDDFETKISELADKAPGNSPRVLEDLIRFGVTRYRNYLEDLRRIPLLFKWAD